MKKVQDHYFKKAKKENYPARSVYKLEEVQKKYSILKKGNKVLDLGCQPGSWSQYAAEIVGSSGLIVGVDLTDVNIGRPATPKESAIHFFCADIMQPETVTLIKTVQSHFDVVMSDMAPRTTSSKWADQQKSLSLSRQTLVVAADLLKSGGNYYCKVFEGEDFKEFVDEVKRLFRLVKIVKPESSRKESREVFVLGIGYQGSQADKRRAGSADKQEQ